jgi:dihydroxyacetone kinase-like predicted kinase
VQSRAAGHQVAVIPVRSVVQALAAVAVHDVRRRYEDDVIAMAEAAGATRAGSVAAGSDDDPVRGLIGSDVVTSGTDVLAVAETVLDRLLGAGGELVTVVGGVGAPVDAVVAMLRRRHGIEVVPYVGGQGDPLLLFGVE